MENEKTAKRAAEEDASPEKRLKKDKKEKKEKKDKKDKKEKVLKKEKKEKKDKKDKKKRKRDDAEEEEKTQDVEADRPSTPKKAKADKENKPLAPPPSPPLLSVEELSPEAFREQNAIKIVGMTPLPAPMLSFGAAPFPQPALKALEQAGFPSPSPIQAQSWPVTLGGRDVISVAKTGSGKTLAFLLPAFKHLAALRPVPKGRGDHPLVLVLAPTRELAVQIQEECDKFGRCCRVRSVCLFGGSPKREQIFKLQGGADVVVATPGRLNDLLDIGKVNLSGVSYLVFDEADRMLDMGFGACRPPPSL